MIPAAARQLLLQVARRSIRSGLAHGRPYSVDPTLCPPYFREPAATFVTLNDDRGLRGCIGRLAAERPLVEDVADNAYAAAFRDPRFPGLAENELAGLEIHISVLGTPEFLDVASETELLKTLRPGEDGLILAEAGRRATFLPSVWKSLPEPGDFLRHLKQKAGFAPDYWSPDVTLYRYGCEEFAESD